MSLAKQEIENELKMLRSKRAIDHTSEGYRLSDLEGYILDVNYAFSTMTGYTAEELKGMHISQLAINDSKEDLNTRIEKIQEKCQDHFESRLRHKDGHLIDIEVSSSYISEVQQIISFSRDITERKQMESALRESQELLQSFIKNAPVALAMFDLEMRYLAVSIRWMTDHSLGDQNIIGQSHYDVFPDIPERWKLLHRRDLNGERLRADEDCFERANGTADWLKWEIWPWRKADGVVGGIVLVSENINDRKQKEQELRKYKNIIESSDDAIIGKTLDGIIESWNFGAEKIFGYSEKEAIGSSLQILIPADRKNEEVEILARIARGERIEHFETVRRHKDGRLINISTSISPVLDRQGKVIGASKIARDITKHKQLEDKVHQLAFYDELTKLPNRRLLNDRLEQAMAASRRNSHYGALLFLDMDNFKPLNDVYGHGMGDLLLLAAARRISSCVRETDTVARFGGDEFVVLLGELDEDKTESNTQASNVAEKIRGTLAEPYFLEIQQGDKAKSTVEHHCTSSIGVVLFLNHKTSVDDIIKSADAAMYQAKNAGRNKIKFYEIKV
jgi:diguanylate cyclase (GGDEF)-like protein/PAS domain S-box-containing protein